MSVNNEQYYIGVDVSKGHLDTYIPAERRSIRFTNDSKGQKQLISRLKPYPSCMVVMEASGGYEKSFAEMLHEVDIRVAVVNPKRVRDFAKALGVYAKTDKIDAQVISRFASATLPRELRKNSKQLSNLREKSIRRHQLIALRTLEKQHLEHASSWQKKEINKSIARLNKSIEMIEKELLILIKSCEILQKKYDILQTVKGIGLISAVDILCQLPELGEVNEAEIAAIIGVAPFNNESGNKSSPRKTWGGRTRVRTALYLAVMSAKRSNPAIKAFFNRLIEKGKKKQVAMIACIRKLAVILNAMLKNECPWEDRVSHN